MRKAAEKPSARGQPTPAPSLAELQARFQAAVIAGDDDILDFIPGNTRTSNDVLIGVYRYAYAARLVDVVAGDHAELKRLMGAADFDTMARAYIAAHPSRTPNARWVAQALPEFLAATAPYAARPELAGLARLERALADAFDAADARALELSDLARHPPERWGDLAFTAHPSVTRLDFDHPILALWRALKDANQPPPGELQTERERLLVWRNGTVSSVRALSPEEAMLWDEAARGSRFAALCELAATYDDADGAALRAAQYLQGWIGSGLLSGAKLLRPRRGAAATTA